MLRRRDLLKLPLAAPAFNAFAVEPFPSLRDAAAARGLRYGSDSDVNIANQTPAYAELFERHCALFAPWLPWSPQDRISLQPTKQEYAVDPNTEFAREHGLKLSGAHLVWYLNSPKWFDQITDPKRMEAEMLAHIRGEVAWFRGQVYSWNVFNEMIDPRQGRADGLRKQSVVVTTLGDAGLMAAFHAAREADPGALLVYNDYDLELDTPDQAARRATMLKLVDRLLVLKAPLDAVGLQSHLRYDRFQDFNPGVYRTFLKELAGRGLKILITELDVFDAGAPGDTAQRDRLVADVYAKFLNTVLDEKAVCALLTWGLSDRYSWQNAWYFAKQFTRPDHLPARPLPFDDALQPKPAAYALLNALRHAPRRQVLPNL